MKWIRRALIVSPFAAAAVLNLLIAFADRLPLNRQHVAGYGFAFGGPWTWLLDHDWFGSIRNRHVETLITYAIILWIPALLYSGCLWFLSRLINSSTRPNFQ